jgi:hypothetical protein
MATNLLIGCLALSCCLGFCAHTSSDLFYLRARRGGVNVRTLRATLMPSGVLGRWHATAPPDVMCLKMACVILDAYLTGDG